MIWSLASLTALIAFRFWLLGAWPVAAISIPEILLVVVLIRLNIRRARASELVLLTGDTLTVTRTAPSGDSRKVVLSAAWLNVALEEAPGRIPRLLLRNRSASEEIGTALGEEPKRALAESLRQALHDLRNPRFDNPQLQEIDSPAT